MKSKKILIIFIVIVATIILAIGGTIFAYATTDFLKSDEQLFYKYIGQTGEKVKKFKSEEIEEYLKKVEETPYESEGKLAVSAKAPINEKTSKLVNDLNITFSGKTDKKQGKSEQEIKINYSDNISFPIEYVRTDNLYGITSNMLLTKYLAIENEDTEGLLNNLETNDNTIASVPNQVNKIISIINGYSFSIEKIDNILNILKTNISENITEKNFSKVNDNSFALTLNEKEIKLIYTEILKDLENNGYISKEETDKIMEEIEDLQTTDKESLKVIVNKSGNITIEIVDYMTIKVEMQNYSQINISMENDDEKYEIKITKNIKESEISYRLEVIQTQEEQKNVFYFEADYLNFASQIAKEGYKFGMGSRLSDEEIIYDYTFDITKRFEQNIDIKTIGKENAVILNDMSKEYIDNVTNTLTSKIEEINKNQMAELGVEEGENPLIFATPIGYMVSQFMNNAMDNIIQSENEWNKNNTEGQNGSSWGDTLNSAHDFINTNS